MTDAVYTELTLEARRGACRARLRQLEENLFATELDLAETRALSLAGDLTSEQRDGMVEERSAARARLLDRLDAVRVILAGLVEPG